MKTEKKNKKKKTTSNSLIHVKSKDFNLRSARVDINACRNTMMDTIEML